MTIRIKIRPDKKAMMRFGNPAEQQWYINTMRSIRDSNPETHPEISIKDHNGDIPKLPPPKPPQDGKPINVPQKLTPEMIKKLEIPPMKAQLVKGKPIEMETKKEDELDK